MSSGESGAAIPCITGLTRIPALKWVNCRVIYSAGCPARLGLTGVALLPSVPWHAEQTSFTIVCALARSGFAGGACGERGRRGQACRRLRPAATSVSSGDSSKSAARHAGEVSGVSFPLPAGRRSICAKPSHCSGIARPGQSRAALATACRGRRVKHPLQQAEFVLTVANDDQLPPPGPPEIAFAGRSNAGKSSAINALANRTRLAFTSKTPGRTQQINFFRLRCGGTARRPARATATRRCRRRSSGTGRNSSRAISRRGSRWSVSCWSSMRGTGSPTLDRAAARGLPAERPPGAGARDQDGQARARGAAQAAAPRIERGIAAAFPGHMPRRSTVVPFSATRRIGDRGGGARARRRGSANRTPDAERGRTASRGKRKGPAIKGSDAGPETPRQD